MALLDMTTEPNKAVRVIQNLAGSHLISKMVLGLVGKEFKIE